jgi:NADH:ubiquinone oxidoreductase subunit 5 (subunit L)/multisubunit Na+/H+ antiporter MnhA subunit
MVLGVVGGGLGIALALYQRDAKRVLAYSSIENVGLVTLGVGVGLWGATVGSPLIATLGLVGALLHLWNHAVMKALLFLAAGSVVHACHERDLEHLGGLFRRMPRTGTAFLVGAVAIAGLPPLNGFVSEWVLYSGLLHGAIHSTGAAGVAMLVAIAAVSLIGAMAALCFVRLLGIALLGEARGEGSAHAVESPTGMILPLNALLVLLVTLAFAPALAAQALGPVVAQLLGRQASHLTSMQASLGYLGISNAVLAGLVALGLVVSARSRRREPPHSDPTWGCGYALPTPRMQYTARSVSELFTTALLPTVLGPRLSDRSPTGPFPQAGHIDSDAEDPITRSVYEPFFARWAERFARLRWMQQGLLHVYISYIVVTLLVALAWSAVAELIGGS